MRNRVLALIVCLLLSGLVSAQDEPTPYEIALERIEEAWISNATELDLSGLGLTEVPSEIGNLRILVVLHLHNNQLRELPPEIGNLRFLHLLYLNHNQFSVLPPEILNLRSLQRLSLADNQLRELPPEIGNLIYLWTLDLSQNQLSELPPEIGNLSKLEWLGLSSNQLIDLPVEIGGLTKLQFLRVLGNPLTTLPTSTVEAGNFAITAYLQNEYQRREAEYAQSETKKQQMFLKSMSGVGLIAALVLGFRIKQHGQRKSKKKRDTKPLPNPSP